MIKKFVFSENLSMYKRIHYKVVGLGEMFPDNVASVSLFRYMFGILTTKLLQIVTWMESCLIGTHITSS